MRLLVKRTAGSSKGALGDMKRKFEMTFKIELSPEEQATVETFDLP